MVWRACRWPGEAGEDESNKFFAGREYCPAWGVCRFCLGQENRYPKSMSTPWLTSLTALFPKGVVASDAETLAAHSGDAWFASTLPQAVVFPRRAEEVAAVLRFANKRRI